MMAIWNTLCVVYAVSFGYAFGSWKIQPFIFPNGATVGQRVSTTCSTSGGRRLSFEWLKDGKSAKNFPHINVASISEFSTIVIEPLSESDSGNYTCVASSEGVTDMYVATLNVYVPPEWVESPYDKEVLSGEIVFLPCSATGKPKPTITWSKLNEIDGKYNLVSNDPVSSIMVVMENGTLSINGIAKRNEGIYQCSVLNEVGNPLKKSASLRVIGEKLK